MFSQTSTLPVLKIYNAFPTRFENGLAGLIDYIPMIKDLGFNCIWLNPIFYAGPSWVQKYDEYLYSSCYAMSSMILIDPRVLPNTEEFREYKREIKEIEDEFLNKWQHHDYQRGNLQLQEVKEYLAKLNAIEKRYGDLFKPIIARLVKVVHEHQLAIIGDLVMNHVSSLQIVFNDDRIQKHFSPDRSFPDVFKIRYTELMKRDVPAYDAVISKWKMFITSQFLELGFDGFRVDAARLLPNEVLDDIYSHIRNTRPNAILFEEVLFSDKSQKTQADEFASRKILPTAVTGSTYYYYFEKTRGNPASFGQVEDSRFNSKYATIDDEAYWKSRYTKLGTINFVGNHDHTSLMGKLAKSNYGDENKKREMWLATYAALSLSGAGGSYLLAGDEWGFETTPRPFVNLARNPIFTRDVSRDTKVVNAEFIRTGMPVSDAQVFYQNHIRIVHAIMDHLHQPFAREKNEEKEIIWVRPVYLPKFNLLVMARRYGSDTSGKTDLVVIDLLPDAERGLTWEQIAKSFEMKPLDDINLPSLNDVTLHLYGVKAPKKEIYSVVEYGFNAKGNVQVVDHRVDASLESEVKTPAAAAPPPITPVSDIRVIRDAAMLHGIFTRTEEAQQGDNTSTAQKGKDAPTTKLK